MTHSTEPPTRVITVDPGNYGQRPMLSIPIEPTGVIELDMTIDLGGGVVRTIRGEVEIEVAEHVEETFATGMTWTVPSASDDGGS